MKPQSSHVYRLGDRVIGVASYQSNDKIIGVKGTVLFVGGMHIGVFFDVPIRGHRGSDNWSAPPIVEGRAWSVPAPCIHYIGIRVNPYKVQGCRSNTGAPVSSAYPVTSISVGGSIEELLSIRRYAQRMA